MAADFDVAVAVAAIEPELPDVNIMLKVNRLHRLITDPRIFRREIIPGGHGHETSHNRQDRTGLHDRLVGAFGNMLGMVFLAGAYPQQTPFPDDKKE